MKQQDVYLPLCGKCAPENGSIFRNLTPDEIEMLNFEKDYRQYKRGEVLYQEGNRISGFYCIHRGIIKVYKTGFDGKEQIIRFARPGEIIAYRSVLSNEVACTSARVIEDCEVCFIPSEILVSLIRTNSAFALDLLKLACHELGEANSFITDIAQKTGKNALLRILLLHKPTARTRRFRIISRSALPGKAGKYRWNGSRVCNKTPFRIQSRQTCRLNGRKIKIINKKGLEKISNVLTRS